MQQTILKSLSAASIVATCFAFSALAQGLPKANQPEEVGFSSERLNRVTKAFQADVDKGLIPGAVVLIARNGKVAYLEAVGFRDRDKKIPMSTNSIFQIASMTKPLTSVAIMMLVEEGKIQLNEPISLYLPEFKGVQVGVEKVNAATGNPELTLEPVQREMTIQDLLRHTSGITYGTFGKSLVKQRYNEANLFDRNQTLAEFVSKLAKLPLAHQPGTIWDYGMSTDVLGRVIEVVSGETLDQFIGERITKPLGLSDTGFYVEPDKSDRIAEPQIDPATGKRPPIEGCKNPAKLAVRWRRYGIDSLRLRAVQPDAIEWRRVGWRAPVVAPRCRLHDLGPITAGYPFRTAGVRAHPKKWGKLRVRVRGPHTKGTERSARRTWQILLGGNLGNGLFC
jgi:CubicO group peptidase (beta-lactamase class C family)